MHPKCTKIFFACGGQPGICTRSRILEYVPTRCTDCVPGLSRLGTLLLCIARWACDVPVRVIVCILISVSDRQSWYYARRGGASSRPVRHYLPHGARSTARRCHRYYSSSTAPVPLRSKSRYVPLFRHITGADRRSTDKTPL
jgi:hypothetical protein